MKAILIVCLLLASIFFIPSSNAAEEKCDPYSRKSCRLKPPAQPLKPVAPPLKRPTRPIECSLIPTKSCTPPPRGQPYKRRSPPPYKRPTPPTPGPPYRRPSPPFNI